MSLFRSLTVTALCAGILLTQNACSGSAEKSSSAPQLNSEWTAGAMATAANPYAVDAAAKMLEQGGHAVDAVIAAHAVLGLVEPQSSGLGGGAFMLVYQRKNQKLVFLDGRETAPAGATVDMFMRDGKAVGFREAWQSGNAVGVPGAVALYYQAHQQYGKLPWEEVLKPAIELAQQGFVVSERLAGFLPRIAEIGMLDENPGAADYFYPQGEPLKAGQLLKNPEYANTLQRVADEGVDAFYTGEIAEAMVRSAQAEPFPGTLSLADLKAYSPIEREPVCGPFRQYSICTATPPSSGAAQIMMMGMYDELLDGSTSQEDKVVAMVDAQRLAYADRDHYFGDPDATDIPIEALIDPRYLKHRANNPVAPAAVPQHGDPEAYLGHEKTAMLGVDTTDEVSGTTHLSIVDAEGNAVSMTATVEAPFGSGRWAAGFLLNNEMTDFAREAVPGKPLPANAIAPGRRPRSSMSPTIVFDEGGELKMVTGSPGGNSIVAYVYKSLLGVLDWGLSPQQASDFPNIIARGETVRVEVGVEQGMELAKMLEQRGYNVQEREGENSGLHIILVNDGKLEGAADSRREGKVAYLP